MTLIKNIYNNLRNKIANIEKHKVILIIAIFFYVLIVVIFGNGNSTLISLAFTPKNKKIPKIPAGLNRRQNGPGGTGVRNQSMNDGSQPADYVDDEGNAGSTGGEGSDNSNTNADDDGSYDDEDSDDMLIPKKAIITYIASAISGFIGTVFVPLLLIICTFLSVFAILQFLNGVLTTIKTSFSDLAYRVSGWLERVSNAIIFGEYNSNEEVLNKAVAEKYEYYYKNYNIEIDLPLLAATLFYDSVDYDNELEEEEEVEFSVPDGENAELPELTRSTVLHRKKYINTLVSNMLSIKLSKFLCQESTDDQGNPIYTKTLLETTVLEEDAEFANVCGPNTVNSHVYEKNYQYDENKYMDKLRNTDILYKIYKSEVLNPENGTEAIFQTVDDMMFYRDIYLYLYENQVVNDCPIVGNITNDLINELGLPIMGDYNITSPFGYRIDPLTGQEESLHAGIDVVPTSIVNIYAVGDGIVVRAGWEDQGGSVIEIRHEINGVSYISQYAHLTNHSTVKFGDAVTKGQIIGIMGDTGNVTGPHLHFQLWQGSVKDRGKVDNLINPTSLFSGAKNYELDCRNTGGYDNCTLKGAIAILARENGYNFNILRSIIQAESSGSENELMTVNFLSTSVKETLQKADPSLKSKAAKEIDFSSKKVYINGEWVSYERSSDQEERHRVVELVAAVTEEVYNDIAMGNAQIKGSNHKAVGYSSAKEMFEALSNSSYNQIKAMINFLERKSEVVSVLKNIGSMSGSQLEDAVWVLVRMYRPGNDEAWVKKVLDSYNEFKADPTSTIDNYINECSKTQDANWEDCVTYEDKASCKKNLSQYKNKANELLTKVQSEKASKVLNYALSLWGKVRYCRSSSKDSSYNVRCQSGSEHKYYKQGFKPAWSELHTYTNAGKTYTAGKSGLDCGGLVTWALNQAFDIYGDSGFDYVLGGACANNNPYTRVVKYTEKYFKNIAHQLKPGDGVCDIAGGTRHTGFFFGYDDKNGNGILDGNDTVYMLHTSTGTRGVEIKAAALTDSYWTRFNTYFTYK